MTLVALAFNDVRDVPSADAQDHLAVEAMEAAVAAVERACEQMGWGSKRIRVGGRTARGLAWAENLIADLDRIQPDVVFNVIEAVNGDARLEAAAGWILELSGIPYTGSPPAAMSLGLDKPVARAVLASHGIPIPRGRVLKRGDEPLGDLRFPVIVKPSREDGSEGIGADSVAPDEGAAYRQARHVIKTYRQSALVEEFIDGREINASLLGEGDALELLPLAEIDFAGYPEGRSRIVTHDAKWRPETPEYRGTRSVAALELDPSSHVAIAAAALGAFRAVGLRDFGRIDLRVHPETGPVVIDVNPNPDISEDAGLARTAARAGIDYVLLIERIVEGALRRGRGAA